MSETITITKKEYDDLQEQAMWADCLDCAGVDNWSGGYEEAGQEFRKWVEERDAQREKENKEAKDPKIVNFPPLFYFKNWLRNTFIDAIKHADDFANPEALRAYVRALEDAKIMLDHHEKGGTDVNPGRNEY